MPTVRESRIVDLAPNLGDGSTVVFTTPSAYFTGSVRVFINGVEYPPDDDCFGWSETTATTITLTTAPHSGDEMAVFYQDDAGVSVSDVVIGSPYAPGEVC